MAKIPIDLKTGEVKKELDLIVGIDLGTTHSLVSFIDGEKSKVVSDETDSNKLVPSIIYFNENDEPVVGNEAKEMLLLHPDRVIYSVKRLLGKAYGDLASYADHLAYKIIETDDEKSLVKIQIGERFYSPIYLSSLILSELKSRAEKATHSNISKAVITVPAYFNDSQRQATRDAGKLAGLDVLRIINEPTAASLAYGIGTDTKTEKTIAVYDLGGGTFDISILQIESGIFEVLSTHGDTFLGGDDVDKAIVEHWRKTINDSSISQGKWRLYAEDAKKALSNSDEFKVVIGEIELSLSKAKLEDITQPLIAKSIDSCKKALKDAEVSLDDIDELILVGGSTRMPYVQKSVETFFNKKANNSIDPDQVVAMGAAVQADILAGNNKDILLLDITPLSLGIETMGGLMDTIIPRNSKVPTKVGRQYTTSIDGQKNLKVAIYQGERDLVEHNRKLGEFILKNIPPMAAGIPKIEVRFLLDADGILRVEAEELRSGVKTDISIKSQYGISEEEMAMMLLDSIKNAQSDMDTRSLLETINEANNLLLSGKRFINQNDAILSVEEKSKTNELLLTLEKEIVAKNKEAIDKAMQLLNDYTAPLAHKALDINISNNLKGTKI